MDRWTVHDDGAGYRVGNSMIHNVTSAQTEDLDETTRTVIIQVCVEAHKEEDFKNLFTYIPSGG